MKMSEIHELTQEELARGLDDHRRELFNLRLQAQTGQLENHARIRQVRRIIARMLTEETARQKRQTA